MAGLVVSRSHLRSAPPRRAAPPRSSTPRSALSPPLNRTRRWRARTPRWCVSPTLSRVRSRPGASARRPRAAVRSNRASASQIPNRPPPPFSLLLLPRACTARRWRPAARSPRRLTTPPARAWPRARPPARSTCGIARRTRPTAPPGCGARPRRGRLTTRPASPSPSPTPSTASASPRATARAPCACGASPRAPPTRRRPSPPPRRARGRRAVGSLRRPRRGASRRVGAARHLAFAPPDAAPGPNGTRAPSLAAAGDDGVVRFYAPRDADALADWELENEAEALAPGGACTALAWRVAAGESSGAGAGAGARDGALTTPKPAMLAVGMHWPATGRSDARVLARDEANARWRVAARLFSGEPRAPATALAWAPDTDAFGGGTETIAAAVGAEVGVFRVEAFPGEARGAATYDEEGPAEKAAAEKAAASGATFSDGGGGAFRRGGRGTRRRGSCGRGARRRSRTRRRCTAWTGTSSGTRSRRARGTGACACGRRTCRRARGRRGRSSSPSDRDFFE